MDKMDEKILVVDRKHLFEDEYLAFQGVLTDTYDVRQITKKFDKYREVRRGDAEENEKWKQPIPYTILKRGSDIFVYKRLKKGNESRLHDNLSIGIGGHMNRINSIHNWNDNLRFNLFKELMEELRITIPSGPSRLPDPMILGLINDDSNEVGRVHIGILALIDLPLDSEVEVLETDKLEGYWLRIRDIKKTPLFESLESWSQIAVKLL